MSVLTDQDRKVLIEAIKQMNGVIAQIKAILNRR